MTLGPFTSKAHTFGGASGRLVGTGGWTGNLEKTSGLLLLLLLLKSTATRNGKDASISDAHTPVSRLFRAFWESCPR